MHDVRIWSFSYIMQMYRQERSRTLEFQQGRRGVTVENRFQKGYEFKDFLLILKLTPLLIPF